MSGLIGDCRQAFELELVAELSDRAALLGITSDIRRRGLIFARQILHLHVELKDLDLRDRIGPNPGGTTQYAVLQQSVD